MRIPIAWKICVVAFSISCNGNTTGRPQYSSVGCRNTPALLAEQGVAYTASTIE
jgi:hypothetical protein